MIVAYFEMPVIKLASLKYQFGKPSPKNSILDTVPIKMFEFSTSANFWEFGFAAVWFGTVQINELQHWTQHSNYYLQ